MNSANDFIKIYESYSDEELFQLNSEIEQYQEEARKAFAIVLSNKGGIEKLKESLASKKSTANEIARLKMEIAALRRKETNPDFVKNLITSNILNKTETDKLVDESFEEFSAFTKANSVDSKAILLAIMGIVISSIVAGTLWSIIAQQSNRIPIFFIIGLGLVCFFIIAFVTKKAKTSPLVLLSTTIAIMLAYLIGQFILPGIISF